MSPAIMHATPQTARKRPSGNSMSIKSPFVAVATRPDSPTTTLAAGIREHAGRQAAARGSCWFWYGTYAGIGIAISHLRQSSLFRPAQIPSGCPISTRSTRSHFRSARLPCTGTASCTCLAFSARGISVECALRKAALATSAERIPRIWRSTSHARRAILGGRVGYMLASYVSPSWMLHDPLVACCAYGKAACRSTAGCSGVPRGWLDLVAAQQNPLFQTRSILSRHWCPIGLGLGRMGNFIGGELWGRHTDAPWGMIFPRALDSLGKSRDELYRMYLDGQLNHEARHQSQLYEFMPRGHRDVSRCSGSIRASRDRATPCQDCSALLYGLFRFQRRISCEPDVQLGFVAFDWLTMGQILSLPLIAVGIALLVASRRAPIPSPQPSP